MDRAGGWSVGEVAGLTSLTVRTLHHWDDVGLLVPGERTASGHRRYTRTDLERLQRVLFYRELGFGLDDIGRLLADGSDELRQLRRQHELLTGRGDQLRRMAEAVAAAIHAHETGITLTPEEMFEVFGDFDPTQYADEARERWGESDAYQQSTARTASYSTEDWQRVMAEGRDVEQRFATAMASGEPADGPVAMDLAEAHRAHIDRSYYDVSYEMHRGLAAMYLADERFAAHYEDIAPGLAQYVHDAIEANADRHARP